MSAFPFYKQRDSMQCGVACLLMICEYYGKKYSYEYISRICCATNEGVSLLAIKYAAKEVGLYAEGHKLDIESLLKLPLPCLLHWNQNHFVILFKVSKDGQKFYIADPGKGLVVFCLEEFKRHWVSTSENGQDTGIAMFFNPTSYFYQMKDSVLKEGYSFNFLIKYLKQYQRFFILIIGGLLLGCLLQLIQPFLTQSIVDVGIEEKNIGFIWMILLGQLLIIIGRTSMDFIRRWLLLHISMRINISLVSDFFIKLLKLPMSFFDSKQMGAHHVLPVQGVAFGEEAVQQPHVLYGHGGKRGLCGLVGFHAGGDVVRLLSGIVNVDYLRLAGGTERCGENHREGGSFQRFHRVDVFTLSLSCKDMRFFPTFAR